MSSKPWEVHDSENNQVKSTTILLGSFEQTVDATGTTYKFYVGDFAETTIKSTESLSQAKVNYFHKDHLGSTVAITDNIGNVVQKFSYDPWGKRRNPTAEAAINDLQYISLGTQLTNKGFTGHEQLDNVGLIHMGGRVYDPTIGRFISADPFIEAPANTQSYNRYSYVMNNPLSYTDPTGYGNFLSGIGNAIGNFIGGILHFTGKILRGVARGVEDLANGIVHAAKVVFRKLAQNQYLQIAVQAAACIGPHAGATCAPTIVAMSAGTAYATTGSLGAAIKAGVIAYAMVQTYNAVGKYANTHFGNPALGVGNTISNFSAGELAGYAGMHAVVGGAFSKLRGGDFRSGAIGGAFSLAGDFVGDATQNAAAGFIAATVAGGTAASLTGGKFANGAQMAAFAYTLNYGSNQLVKKALSDGHLDLDEANEIWRANTDPNLALTVDAGQLTVSQIKPFSSAGTALGVVQGDDFYVHGSVTLIRIPGGRNGSIGILPGMYDFEQHGSFFSQPERNFKTYGGFYVASHAGTSVGTDYLIKYSVHPNVIKNY